MADDPVDASGRDFADTLDHIVVRGLHVAYRRARTGAGPTVVCLHGLMDTGASFSPLIDELMRRDEPRYDLIAPDWRGHGNSDATPGDYWFPNYLADLEGLLDALAIDTPVVLVGHSMGGQAASLFAGARPERVAGLVLLDSLNVPDSDSADAPARYRDWLDARRHGPRARPSVYERIEDLTTRLATRYPELTHARRQELARQWLIATEDGRWRLRVDSNHRRRMPYGFRAADAKALWREVTSPVLCIDGGDSPARRLIAAEEMADRRACFENLARHTLDGCGHMLHIQAPRAVAALVRDFLQQLDGAR